MNYIYKDELYHHGIKGQRWGVRRFQNPDGTRTEEGKKRYSDDEKRERIKSIAKKVAIGTTIGAAVIAGYATYKISKNKYMDKIGYVDRLLDETSFRFGDMVEATRLAGISASKNEDYASWMPLANHHLNKGIDSSREMTNELKKLDKNIYKRLSSTAKDEVYTYKLKNKYLTAETLKDLEKKSLNARISNKDLQKEVDKLYSKLMDYHLRG